jgi:hypothetical protein
VKIEHKNLIGNEQYISYQGIKAVVANDHRNYLLTESMSVARAVNSLRDVPVKLWSTKILHDHTLI